MLHTEARFRCTLRQVRIAGFAHLAEGETTPSCPSDRHRRTFELRYPAYRSLLPREGSPGTASTRWPPITASIRPTHRPHAYEATTLVNNSARVTLSDEQRVGREKKIERERVSPRRALFLSQTTSGQIRNADSVECPSTRTLNTNDRWRLLSSSLDEQERRDVSSLVRYGAL